jgi:sirohydrochlorin cobaltochelatase
MEQLLAAALSKGACNFGQVAVRKGFVLTHVDDVDLAQAEIFRNPEEAIALAKFDDAGKYRPLKTAPNLRHGWRMELIDLGEVARALDYFYPARLSILREWKEGRLKTTPLRATLDRQSGMYRVAANISDEQIDEVVADTCRTDGGCLRHILWRRDATRVIPSTKLPPGKYDPRTSSAASMPLLCQEACTVLINACRKRVKEE